MNDSLADLRQLNLPFNVDKVNPMCHRCLRRQLKKYDKAIDADGSPCHGRFLVPCTGVPLEPVDSSLRAAYTDEEWEEILSLYDSVRWARNNLEEAHAPWVARWYQEEILRCSARRRVLRMSRRTGKTTSVCVDICYYMFTHENMKILLAGPQKTHVEEVIKRIRNFIYDNPKLANEVVRDVSAPYYEITLANGSYVRGFAAGTKGKMEGVSIRGQDADRIYVEEMAFIDDNAIKGAILPILMTTPETVLVGFSTPTAFKTTYYRLCEESPHYKEFHYTYKVLPWYRTVELERSEFTDAEWEFEYLAGWGASEEGVYQPSYIDRAMQIYRYADCKRQSNWYYTIGVDWNETHGTELCVLGFDRFSNKYKVVDAIRVPKAEFTQLEGIEKLLEWNHKWHPDYIYIDAGAGAANYEILRKRSYDARRQGQNSDTARLLDILKAYNSSTALDIKDPVTGEARRVPAKPFMVNSSVRMFEQDRMIISASDHILENQLRNYIVERMTPTGNPVYGLKEPKVKDHRLDALNLAIVAFALEFDELFKQQTVVEVGAVPRADIQDKLQRSQGHPEDRRLEGSLTPLERTLFGLSGSAHTVEHIPSNRPGWDTDEEERYHQEWLQRRRARQRKGKSRPRRTTF